MDKTILLPTEEDVKAHDYMMECLINISAHIHLMQGHIDALFPVKNLVFMHEPSLMQKLIDVGGKGKIANKTIAKNLVRDDDEAIDLMYAEIGRSISAMAKLPIDKAKLLTEKINELVETFENK